MDVRVREDAHLRVDCPEPGRFRTARRYAFIVGAIGCFSASASAADQRYNLEIGAGSIPEALSEIEAMTKAALVWSPEQVVNAVTSGVSGVFTVEEALELVLRGTALRAERRNGLYVISPLRVTSADTEHHNSSDPRGNLSTSLAVADSRSQEFEHEEIVITGTRVVRDGFEAPTPVTVIDREYFNHYAPSNIADFVNFLPSIAGGVTPHQGGGGISNQTKGLNTLNLRGLGSNRTLILLDGVRVPATALDGSVDISQIPDALVQRVDVVTGGASAAHGSDALSGVINFVLDRSYTGVKGTIQGGITSYGDDGSYRVSLTSGFDFPSERGHLLLSAQTSYVSGIFHSDRDWNREGWMIMSNPSYSSGNGQPQHLLTREVGLSLATPGGLITSGPLKGIYFGQNGDPGQLTYGSLIA